MASLTEQLQEDTKNGIKDAAKTGEKTVQAVGKGGERKRKKYIRT